MPLWQRRFVEVDARELSCRGGEITSTEKRDPQKDLMKLLAYTSLTNFWTNLAAMPAMTEEEARGLLRLQNAVIKEFEKTLSWYLDSSTMEEFAEFVTANKVWAD